MMPTLTTDDQMEIALQEDTQAVMHLLTWSQTLPPSAPDGSFQLCQEVVQATAGRARLLLSADRSSRELPFSLSNAVSFPVRFHHRSYGRLYLVAQAPQTGTPALALPVAHLLSHLCGWLLYTLEIAALVEGQCQRLALDGQLYGHLTAREQQVLALICRGEDQQAIASQLQISQSTVETHRKHLCQKLGVHSERDLPLAAYRARLFALPNATWGRAEAPSQVRTDWSRQRAWFSQRSQEA